MSLVDRAKNIGLARGLTLMEERTADFSTTHWSLVLCAGGDGTPESRDALAKLCEAYWYPVYAYIRRRGYPTEDARDLTQAFFTRLLEKRDLRSADPTRGRFRSFLLTAVRHFLANEFDWRAALKRGAGHATFSLEIDSGENRYIREPPDLLDPEKIFERRWAMDLLGRAVESLRADCARAGDSRLFEALRPCLTDAKSAPSHRAIGEHLEMSEGAVGVAVHRLRHRFGAALRREVAQTVSADAVDDELRYLLRALGS